MEGDRRAILQHTDFFEKTAFHHLSLTKIKKQKEIISCIARYHRGSLPDKKEHDVYCNLDKKERKTVKRLGGILKIADGLSHVKFIDKVKILYDEENNITEILIVPSDVDFRPDLGYVIKKKDLFELGFKTQAVFKFEQ